MKFKFTTRGLFLLTTFASVVVTLCLWIAKSPLFGLISLYLFVYFTLFSILYVFRYRRQLQEFRTAWSQRKIARASLNEEVERRSAAVQQSIEQPSGEET